MTEPKQNVPLAEANPLTCTPCCKYRFPERETGPIYWNPFNRVVQCHACGQCYQSTAAVQVGQLTGWAQPVRPGEVIGLGKPAPIQIEPPPEKKLCNCWYKHAPVIPGSTRKVNSRCQLELGHAGLHRHGVLQWGPDSAGAYWYDPENDVHPAHREPKPVDTCAPDPGMKAMGRARMTYPPELEAFAPSFDPDMRTAIFEAVGAASMCWSDIEKAGLFRTEHAQKIAEELWCRVCEGAGHKTAEEHRRRVYYQDLVMRMAGMLDRTAGKTIVIGNANEPCDEPIVTLQGLLEERMADKKQLDALAEEIKRRSDRPPGVFDSRVRHPNDCPQCGRYLGVHTWNDVKDCLERLEGGVTMAKGSDR